MVGEAKNISKDEWKERRGEKMIESSVTAVEECVCESS